MWLPLEQAVSPTGNGMLVAKHSHREHLNLVSNGTWDSFGTGVKGQLEILDMYRRMGETAEHWGPSLEVGDVLVFSKCAVHSCSGDNSDHTPSKLNNTDISHP